MTPDSISSVITASSSIPITGKIEDDYGLAEAAVSLRRIASTDQAEAITNTTQTVSMSLPTQSSTVLNLTKEPSVRIHADSLPAKVGDELELVVSANDCCENKTIKKINVINKYDERNTPNGFSHMWPIPLCIMLAYFLCE